MAEVLDLTAQREALAFATEFVAGRFKDVRELPTGGWSVLCPLCDADTRLEISRELIIDRCPNGHTRAQIVDATSPQEPTLSVNVAAFFASCKDEIEWLLEPYVCRGGFTLIQGAPKSGKTWLAAWIAVAVAQTQEVLFVEEEGAPETLRDRLKPFLPDPTAVKLHVMFRKRTKLDVTSSIDGLIAETLRISATLVVLDPFIALHSKREKESDEMAMVLDAVRQLITETGCAVLLLHHTRKGESWNKGSSTDASSEDARGSGALVGDVDHVVAVKALPASKRKEGEVAFVVENPDTRLQAPFAKKLCKIDLATGSMLSEDAEAMRETPEMLLERLMSILPLEPQRLGQSDARSALRVKMDRLRESVFLGVERGLLISTHKGMSKRTPNGDHYPLPDVPG